MRTDFWLACLVERLSGANGFGWASWCNCPPSFFFQSVYIGLVRGDEEFVAWPVRYIYQGGWHLLWLAWIGVAYVLFSINSWVSIYFIPLSWSEGISSIPRLSLLRMRHLLPSAVRIRTSSECLYPFLCRRSMEQVLPRPPRHSNPDNISSQLYLVFRGEGITLWRKASCR